jgi:hypothetical protein
MSKYVSRILVIAAIWTMVAYWGNRIADKVHAQSTSQVLQVSGTYASHTSCTVSAGQASLCLASDGLWLSVNGGAFTQVGAGAVTSVNGKTGAVVISATTTSTTSLQ